LTQEAPSGAILLVVSGPGGAGKSTLCQRLAAGGCGAELSISTTTRSPRGEEQHGVHYFFSSRESFEADVAAGRFAEHAEVAGDFYGTPRDFLDSKLSAGIDVILDIDVQGARQVREAYGRRAVLVFVVPPGREVLEERLRGRGTDSEARVAERMALAEREIEAAGNGGYDYLVINDALDDALANLAAIRRAERNAMSREGSKAAWVLKTWT
jgi:guanylate kinase